MKGALPEVTEQLKKLSLSYNEESVVASLYQESQSFSTKIKNKSETAHSLVVKRGKRLNKLSANDGLKISENDSIWIVVPEDLLEEENYKLNSKRNQLYKEDNKVLDKHQAFRKYKV